MERLGEHHRFPVVKRRVRLCALRFLSRSELAGCAQEMAECRAALARAEDAYDDAVDARVASTAEIAYRDAHLGEAVASLARDVDALVDGRADDPRRRRIFLANPSAAMKPLGGDAQDRFVSNVLDVLENDDAFASLRRHAPGVRARQDALTAAFARRTALQLDEARAGRALDIAADAARKLYNQMIHRASLQYPDDAALVESFFADGAPARAADAPASLVTPQGGSLTEGAAGASAAVVQQPANESAATPAAPARRARRRRTG